MIWEKLHCLCPDLFLASAVKLEMSPQDDKRTCTCIQTVHRGIHYSVRVHVHVYVTALLCSPLSLAEGVARGLWWSIQEERPALRQKKPRYVIEVNLRKYSYYTHSHTYTHTHIIL